VQDFRIALTFSAGKPCEALRDFNLVIKEADLFSQVGLFRLKRERYSTKVLLTSSR